LAAIAGLWQGDAQFTYSPRYKEIQAAAKVSQIQQSRAGADQRAAKEKALISLDRLGGIGLFQGLAPTP
jgi:hypothetical protein